MTTTPSAKGVLGGNAEERDRVFAKLNQEDEEFRRKIVDLHRKLSDVDDTACALATTGDSLASIVGAQGVVDQEAERLRELESVARRAEETNSRNAEEMNAERRREAAELREGSVRSISEASDRRRYKCRRQTDQFLQRRSRRLDEEATEDQSGASPSGSSETNFLNRLRIKRRSMKLLSFLSGKAADKSQEERAARLLRMYMPERSSRSQNTISIHHTSRDRRFWKLRNRRRNNSA